MAKAFIGTFDQSMLEDLVEFDKRYTKTYLYVKLPDKPEELFFCAGIANNGVIFRNGRVGEMVLSSSTDSTLSVRWPEPRLFNYENHFLYLVRLPERQWKRAPCYKTVMMSNPLSSIFTGDAFIDWDEDSLRAAIEYSHNSYIPIIEVINQFKTTDKIGHALNSQFAVSIPPGKLGKYLLWYYNRAIAWIQPKDFSIEIGYEPLRQEVQDFLRDSGESKWHLI